MEHTERVMKSAKLRARSEQTLTVIWICVAIDDQNAGAEEHYQHQPWIQHHFSCESIFFRKILQTQKAKKMCNEPLFTNF